MSTDVIKGWRTWDGKAYFPLGYDGFSPGKESGTSDRFPRTITASSTMLVFDTGWITAIGGVEKPAYGYVLLSDDGQAVSIYHLWGE